MQSGILAQLLTLIGDPTGTLKTLLRKGLAAVRGLLGKGRGLLREVLKRVLSFLGAKIRPAAAAARDTLKSSLESLKRRAQAMMQGKAPPAHSDLDEPALDPEPADAEDAKVPQNAARAVEPTASEVRESASATGGPARVEVAEVAPSVAAASEDENVSEPPIEAAAPALRTAPSEPNKLRRARETGRRGEAGEGSLTHLAPALRRAFARAVARPGGTADTRRAA